MGLVRRAVEEIWNQGDLALADVLFAPDYVNHGGLIPDLVRGPEAIKSGVALYRTAFPDLHITVEALAAREEMVDLRWTARGTTPAPRAGSSLAPSRGGDNLPAALARGAPTGPLGTLRGTTRSRLAAGQIAESWTSWDRVGVLQRLGLILKSAPGNRIARGSV